MGKGPQRLGASRSGGGITGLCGFAESRGFGPLERKGRAGKVAAADPRIAPPSRYAHCRAPLLTAISPPAVSLARNIVMTIQPAKTSQAAAREDDANATPRMDAIKTPRTMSRPHGMTRYRSEKIRMDRCA